MKARGKRRAKRGASPLGKKHNEREALKERNNYQRYFALSVLSSITRGDALRVAQRLPLAFIFCAFGAPQTDLFSEQHSITLRAQQEFP